MFEAGTAKTGQFMLGSATVMIGPMADLFNLTPTEHSIGLVKNFTIDVTPQFQDLTQGTRNSRVYSVMIAEDTKCSMEVYEYTASNLAYGMGLDGSTFAAKGAATATTAAIDGDPATATTVPVVAATGLTVGTTIMVQHPTNKDLIAITKITAVETLSLTVSPGIGFDLPTASIVRAVNVLPIAASDSPSFFGCKVVGVLANGEEVTILIPKVLVTKGFTMAFQTKDYGNMPYELSVYDLLAADANFASFGQQKAVIYAST